MAAFLDGDDDLFAIYVTDAYVPVGCAESNGISESASMTTRVTKCDPGVEIVTARTSTATISVDGVVTTTSGVLSWTGLKTYLRNKTLITWRNGPSGSYEYGTGYIESLDKTAEAANEVTFSMSVKVSGSISSVDPEA